MASSFGFERLGDLRHDLGVLGIAGVDVGQAVVQRVDDLVRVERRCSGPGRCARAGRRRRCRGRRARRPAGASSLPPVSPLSLLSSSSSPPQAPAMSESPSDESKELDAPALSSHLEDLLMMVKVRRKARRGDWSTRHGGRRRRPPCEERATAVVTATLPAVFAPGRTNSLPVNGPNLAGSSGRVELSVTRVDSRDGPRPGHFRQSVTTSSRNLPSRRLRRVRCAPRCGAVRPRHRAQQVCGGRHTRSR